MRYHICMIPKFGLLIFRSANYHIIVSVFPRQASDERFNPLLWWNIIILACLCMNVMTHNALKTKAKQSFIDFFPCSAKMF